MINNAIEYKGALGQIKYLENWLGTFDKDDPGASALTKTGIRKKLIQIHKEVAAYERKQQFENERKRRSA